MPNWCENKLSIRGIAKELRRFFKDNRATKATKEYGTGKATIKDLAFSTHLPTPKELSGKDAARSIEDFQKVLEGELEPRDWYEWRNRYWGTKWDPHVVKVTKDYEDGLLLYDLDTAWSPPVPWLVSVSKAYPQLKFRLSYEEAANDFEGFVLVQNGEILREYEGGYSKCIHCHRKQEACDKDKCEERLEWEKEENG